MTSKYAGHTPGPWAWDNFGESLKGANGKIVADDGSANGEYGQVVDVDGPDGQLIADAPKLLEQRDRLLTVLTRIATTCDDIISLDEAAEAVKECAE